MRSEDSLTYLIKDTDDGKSFALVSVLLIVGFSFHGFTFFVSIDDEIRAKYAESEFSIEFGEDILQYDESILVGDGDTEILEISRDDSGISSDQMISKIEILVSYSETSGELLDPCDEVRVEIPPNGMTADWQNSNNILVNSTDDCESMGLVVYVYPGYNGTNHFVEGEDVTHWNDMWTNQTYGEGVMNLRISVDTNRPAGSFAPTIDDDDERIEISWTMVAFNVEITEM